VLYALRALDGFRRTAPEPCVHAGFGIVEELMELAFVVGNMLHFCDLETCKYESVWEAIVLV
jgi:hypothetical protein